MVPFSSSWQFVEVLLFKHMGVGVNILWFESFADSVFIELQLFCFLDANLLLTGLAFYRASVKDYSSVGPIDRWVVDH
jgi:hypothetical protein